MSGLSASARGRAVAFLLVCFISLFATLWNLRFKPGDGVVIPPNTPHAGGKNGDKASHLISTYIVEKGKPLASPA